MENLPVGFRFLPTDVELVEYYLKLRISGVQFPDSLIHECNIYNYTPDQLACKYGVGEKNEMYFFSERERVSACASRPSRTAGGGYWRSNRTYEVRDKEDKLIGHKKSLKFYKATKEPTDWLMDEYTLVEGDEAMAAIRAMKRMRTTVAENQHNGRVKTDGVVLSRIHRHGHAAETYKMTSTQEDSRDEILQQTQIPADAQHDLRASTEDLTGDQRYMDLYEEFDIDGWFRSIISS